MSFGENSSRADLIRWYWADDNAKDLGFPTPFVSRNWDQWEIWPDVGEQQYAARPWVDGNFPIDVPGVREPCGDRDIWSRGTIGTPKPIYPRNMFGLMACCGGLIALPGQPTFGFQPQSVPSVTPVPLTGVVGQDVTKLDEEVDYCLTLDLERKAIYPIDIIDRKEVASTPEESPYGKESIFGGL